MATMSRTPLVNWSVLIGWECACGCRNTALLGSVRIDRGCGSASVTLIQTFQLRQLDRGFAIKTDPSTSLVATIRQVCLSEGEKPMTATNGGCRRSRLTAVLISVAVVTLALSSCAETERPQLSASAQDASQRLVALSSRIMGNEVERSAGALVAFHQLQSRVADCMLERGHVYTPPRFVNYWEGLAAQPSHGATSLLDPLDNDLGIAVQKSSPAVLYFARNGLAGSDEVKSRAYEDALDHCGQLGGGGSSDAPAAALRLRTDLDIWIEETTGGIGYEHAPYRSCMAEQDFDVVNNAELYEYVAARFPSPLESPAGGTGTEDWQAAVQLEQRAAAADATCRADIVDSGLQLVAADLGDWIAAHESDLGQLDASWTALVREAQSLPQWPRVERTLIMNQSAEPPSA